MVNFVGWVVVLVVVNNLVGNYFVFFDDQCEFDFSGVGVEEGLIDMGIVFELFDFLLIVEYGLLVFLLYYFDFSINFDGVYDLSIYCFENYIWLFYGGSVEFVVGFVFLCFGI